MSSMIKLKNIERNNHFIECDIQPEDSKEYGHLKINLDTGKIDEYTLPKDYEWCQNHIRHAQITLLELVGRDEPLPDNKLLMWY